MRDLHGVPRGPLLAWNESAEPAGAASRWTLRGRGRGSGR